MTDEQCSGSGTVPPIDSTLCFRSCCWISRKSRTGREAQRGREMKSVQGQQNGPFTVLTKIRKVKVVKYEVLIVTQRVFTA